MKVKNISLLLVYLLLAIGLVFISISSLAEAQSTFGDKFYFLKKQLIWLGLGTISLFVFSKVNLNLLKKTAFPFYCLSLFLLLVVLIPGLGNSALGARRWFNIAGIGIQPSELFKFCAVIYFAHLFSHPDKRQIQTLLSTLAPPLILIILQPNLSTTILIAAIVLTIYYLSGADIYHLLAICSLGLLFSLALIFISPYRRARLTTLLSPQNEATTTSYHSRQITLSLASGGLWGRGFANSSQKYQFLPKVTTDSILAVIAEETGFIGSLIILVLYLLLVLSLLKISQQSPVLEHQLMSAGIAAWIGYQSLINISAIASIIPLTGMPLPFISYGGSSLLTLMAAIGLTNNISRQSSTND
jgi:cell division protein FtsW